MGVTIWKAKDGKQYRVLDGVDAEKAVERHKKELEKNFKGCEDIGVCPDCGGNCDEIYAALKKELGR